MANATFIPIIDLSESQADPASIATRLVDAAAEHGFVYIKNTGLDISVAQVEQAFSIVCENSLRRSLQLSPYRCID